MTTDPFNIREAVPDFEGWVARYRQGSAAAVRDPANKWLEPLRYGLEPEQVALVARPSGVPPPAGWPLHVFVHGGYWRAFEPETYRYLASAICGLGAVAVLPGYRKMPGWRLGDLVSDARVAWGAALAGAPGWGADPDRATASGHSAGAHLASFLAAARAGEAAPDTPPRRLLLLSGIYNPAPLRESFLQAEIGLTDEDCAWAPLAAELPQGTEVTLIIGAAEAAPFHEQAYALAAHWGAAVEAAEDQDHMSVVHALATPGTAPHAALARTILGAGAEPSP